MRFRIIQIWLISMFILKIPNKFNSKCADDLNLKKIIIDNKNKWHHLFNNMFLSSISKSIKSIKLAGIHINKFFFN